METTPQGNTIRSRTSREFCQVGKVKVERKRKLVHRSKKWESLFVPNPDAKKTNQEEHLGDRCRAQFERVGEGLPKAIFVHLATFTKKKSSQVHFRNFRFFFKRGRLGGVTKTRGGASASQDLFFFVCGQTKPWLHVKKAPLHGNTLVDLAVPRVKEGSIPQECFQSSVEKMLDVPVSQMSNVLQELLSERTVEQNVVAHTAKGHRDGDPDFFQECSAEQTGKQCVDGLGRQLVKKNIEGIRDILFRSAFRVRSSSTAPGRGALCKCWAWHGRGAAVCPSRPLASPGVRVLTMTKVGWQGGELGIPPSPRPTHTPCWVPRSSDKNVERFEQVVDILCGRS